MRLQGRRWNKASECPQSILPQCTSVQCFVYFSRFLWDVPEHLDDNSRRQYFSSFRSLKFADTQSSELNNSTIKSRVFFLILTKEYIQCYDLFCRWNHTLEYHSNSILIEISVKEERYRLKCRYQLEHPMDVDGSVLFSVAARKFTPREQGKRGGCEISGFWSGDRGAGWSAGMVW